VAVCRCRVCGARVVTRSVFELDCSECGADEALVAEDAYDPEPDELRCSRCAYVVEGGVGAVEYDADYAGSLTVDDPCPRCGGVLVPRGAAAGASGAVRQQPEFALARAAARRLLEEHWTGETPVDVKRIAAAVGLMIRGGYFGHEGLLKGDVIEIPNESRAAQRFAIAHEIGHRRLRHQVNEDKIESEANAFASELLLPRERLRRAVEVGLGLRELAEMFDISRPALHWALEDARLLNKVST
jgi:hypothetical protein